MEMKTVPPSVRVLPLGTKKIWKKEEKGIGSEIKDVQRWLLEYLREGKSGYLPGQYCSLGRLMKAQQGTIVLFQYQNQIIGSAELIGTEKESDNASECKGYYYFEPESIKKFDPAVSFDIMRKIFGEDWNDPTYKGGKKRPGLSEFQQILWHLNPNEYYRFEEIVNKNK